MKLVVLGNGFGLWLGLPTKYSDFISFLEQHYEKYKNFLNLLKKVVQVHSKNEDKKWNNLEDDMAKFLYDFFSRQNLQNFKSIDNINNIIEKSDSISDIDIKKALDEKNKSLLEWVKSIQEIYKEELEKLQLYFKEYCSKKDNEIFIWSFNYSIDYYKPFAESNDKLQIKSNAFDPVTSRRMCAQCHLFVFGQYCIEIKLGANYRKLVKKLKDDKNFDNFDNYVKNNVSLFCLIRTLTKFCNVGYNNYNNDKFITSEDMFDPIQNIYDDWITNIPHFCWTNRKITKEIYFLGFGFGDQDQIYFMKDIKANPLKYCNIYFTYYYDDEKNKIEQKLNIYKNKIKPYRMDDLLEKIFGSDGYKKLCEIKKDISSKIQKKD